MKKSTKRNSELPDPLLRNPKETAPGKRSHKSVSGATSRIENPSLSLTLPDIGSVSSHYFDYSPTRIEAGAITNIDDFLEEPMPSWVVVRWINVSNTDPDVINRYRLHFDFHALAAENVLESTQRPRVERFDDHLFLVLRMFRLIEGKSEGKPTDWTLDSEQVSIFLYPKVLMTFQEKRGDVWEPVRERLNRENLRARKSGPGYLLYSLLDAVVDNFFPILEHYGDILEDLEQRALEDPSTEVLHRIHFVKLELAMIRRTIWPTREVIDHIYRDESGFIDDSTKPYLRDVYEHTIQVVEIVESYRELASGLNDLYMSSVSNRMNEIMKVLTIMASIFIPLTFISGVYGMNFQFMPEISWRWGYLSVWALFILLTLMMVFYFKRKGWIGKD